MKNSKTLLWFIAPGFIIYSMFFVFPALATFYYSFTNWDGLLGVHEFIGIDNYKRLFNDSIFKTSFTNNIKFMLCVVVLQFIFSLIFAIFVDKNTKVNIFFRALYYFPTILSSVSIAFIWLFTYDPNYGVINTILQWFGFNGVNWLGDPKIAIFSVAIVQVWFHTGQMIVIFVAGLQSIPRELYEAAMIEGASKWQTFKHVTWPLIAPSAIIVCSYTTVQSFKAFDLIFAMTRGGPNYSTEILSTYIYNTAFLNSQFGYASAVSIIFLIIVGFITICQFKALRIDRVNY